MIQEPSYHLEGIIHSRDELEDFTGPLDVILMLLAKNKVEIRDIQISLLLEQYLDYLHRMQEMDLEIASEFVQMASHLTYIKTRMLLTEDKEPTELEVLVSALEQMKNREAMEAVRLIAPDIGKSTENGLRMQSRGPLPLPQKELSYSHTADELISSLAQILLRGGTDAPPRELENLKKAMPRAIVYSVREKSCQLIELLREKKCMSLRELFAICTGRSELVATFLSVLELCHDGQVRIEGEDGSYVIRETLSEDYSVSEKLAELDKA